MSLKNVRLKRSEEESILKIFNHWIFIGNEHPRARIIYKQSTEMADKCSNFIWNTITIQSSLYIIPATIASYYNYFIQGEMEQAFQLPMPSA